MNLIRWPIIGKEDISAMMRVAQSGVFLKGQYSKELEIKFSEFISVKYCQTVSSCTHAIHLALIAAGIGSGDEVLVPDFTYVGSVSPIINAGAIPVFVDIDPMDYNISIGDISRKITTKTKAIIPVHLHGYPCNVELIRSMFPNLIIIEDACQAPGVTRNGIYTGTIGDIGCFSLNQVKPLCGGQGGIVVTNNPKLWERIKILASPGKDETVGLSYEMTEMSAALALSQLIKLEQIIKCANCNYDHFREAIREGLRDSLPVLEDKVVPVWHKLRLKLGVHNISKAINIFNENNIPYDTWPYNLVSQRSEYKSKYGDISYTPNSRAALSQTIILGNEIFPFHAQKLETIIKWAEIINKSF